MKAPQSTTRRAVLRVCHDVDDEGRVIQVQVEPLPDVPLDSAVWAAWQAARRCHPWIVGDDAIEKIEAARTIALHQVLHLMNVADEALILAIAREHDTYDRLRDAVADLRGYLPALRGELPAAPEKIMRRAG